MKKIIIYLAGLFILSGCADELTFTVTETFENGNKATIEVTNGPLLLKRISYAEDGTETVRESYGDLGLDSKWISSGNELHAEEDAEYFGNGNRKHSGAKIGDEMHGKWSYYNRHGHLETERYFNMGEPTGIWIWYTEEGAVDRVEDHGQSKFEGELKEYYPNGQVKKTALFRSNQLNGPYIRYFEDGSVKIRGEYVNGMQANTWNWYFANGQLQKEASFSNGELSGDWRQYYSNGQVKIRGVYADNNRQGQWMWYDEEGTDTHSQIY